MNEDDLREKTALVKVQKGRSEMKRNPLMIVAAVLAFVLSFGAGVMLRPRIIPPPTANCKRKCQTAIAQAKKALPPPPKCKECKKCVVKKLPSKKLTKLEKEAFGLLHVWRQWCENKARKEFVNQSMCLRWTKLGNAYLKADILDEKKLRRRCIAMVIYDQLGNRICSQKKLGMDEASKTQIRSELSSLYSNRKGNIAAIKRANLRRIKAGKKPVKIPELRKCYSVKFRKGKVKMLKWVWDFQRPKSTR
ncbi:hypothetical protein ACFL3C_01160 [Patescibacteria group bacterium]